MKNWQRISLILVIVVGLLLWFLSKNSFFPSFKKIFDAKEVAIDETPLLIKEIKPLAQLVTITAYNEILVDSVMKTSQGERIGAILNPLHFGKILTSKKLVIIGKTMVQVGVDLQKLSDDDIIISNDSIHLALPAAEILDIILNPSGTEIFSEQGSWTNEAVVDLKQKIQKRAEAIILEQNLLMIAESRTKEVLQQFLQSAGYKHVTIQFKTPLM
ncbi:MAG: DUF4230 domain-containing protein [Bacteroidota bacterium]|nr:DUF4230 domain-containing protein [Flavisolibacter sp.]MDQ3552294.1 DUF4230 domain-containing protein [Bacteroidota bacterium]